MLSISTPPVVTAGTVSAGSRVVGSEYAPNVTDPPSTGSESGSTMLIIPSCSSPAAPTIAPSPTAVSAPTHPAVSRASADANPIPRTASICFFSSSVFLPCHDVCIDDHAAHRGRRIRQAAAHSFNQAWSSSRIPL